MPSTKETTPLGGFLYASKSAYVSHGIFQGILTGIFQEISNLFGTPPG
jgi:hypothetical protein